MGVRYKGYNIEHTEDGYSAKAGPDNFGYCDTLQELKDEIDHHIAQERANDPAYPPPDTPCLDDSFHRYEMEV